MAETVQHFIAGKSAPGNGKRFGDVFNPATGEVARLVMVSLEMSSVK